MSYTYPKTWFDLDGTLKSITDICQQENMTREEIAAVFKSINWKKLKDLRNIEAAVCRSCFGEDINFMTVDIIARTPAVNVQFYEVLNAKRLKARTNQLKTFLKQHELDKYFKISSKLNNFREITLRYNDKSNITLEEINTIITLCKICFSWNDDF